jgi:hypothetical protein
MGIVLFKTQNRTANREEDFKVRSEKGELSHLDAIVVVCKGLESNN